MMTEADKAYQTWLKTQRFPVGVNSTVEEWTYSFADTVEIGRAAFCAAWAAAKEAADL